MLFAAAGSRKLRATGREAKLQWSQRGGAEDSSSIGLSLQFPIMITLALFESASRSCASLKGTEKLERDEATGRTLMTQWTVASGSPDGPSCAERAACESSATKSSLERGGARAAPGGARGQHTWRAAMKVNGV